MVEGVTDAHVRPWGSSLLGRQCPQILRCSTAPLGIPGAYFAETGKVIIKFLWKLKGPRIARTIMQKKNNVGGLTLFHFKTSLPARGPGSATLAGWALMKQN